MDFQLSEQENLVREMARDFAQKELIPRAKQHDIDETIDPAIFPMLNELGLMGMTIGEEYGGAGMGNMELAVALEELNAGCASVGVTVSVHNSLLGSPITKWGTDEQKQEWLPRLATGELLGAYCLTEPNAGSDAAAVATSAVRDGDDWIINGTKIFVTNGDWAGLCLVYCRTDTTVSKAKGVTAFLVPMSAEGATVGKKEKKTGIRGSSTTEMVFQNVRVPASAVLGEVNKGFMIAMDTLDGGRIGIASQAVGIGQACLDASVKYANAREQFGRPIAAFQAIQFKIADMSTRLEASRLLVRKAAWLRDNGQVCTQAAAQAKLFASITSNFCADECLQIHGGAGYTDDFQVERLFRDARITEIYEGATDIQRIVISRNLLG
ncbi:MAG: butyryl-CoA dehydrogenase [Bacteroidia bacterium]|jgi:butyryl-CoA dehydrogenase